VAELARVVPGAADESVPVDEVAAGAVQVLLEQIKATLERYQVRFDTFFSERSLHDGSPSELEQALELVERAGHTYRSDGALWLRTTTFGDDKDRVLTRSDGAPTYFAADVAYMLNKRSRGWERQLVPVGADHHGYVARLKAAFAALGGDPELLEPLIIQFVHLVEGGQVFAMSKRRGDFVTLDDLIDEIGVDATRFFMLQRSHDRTLELDVALARSQSQENPVYYVQYAHARISSVLDRVGSARVEAALTAGADWGGETELHPSERGLIRKLVALPEEVAEAAERRAPHRIAAYALELAQDFTAFYRDCHVVGAQPEAVESFRVAVCVASQRVLALVLGLLGVSAPASM
jgi:arginyl-tRNA synthetase